MCRPFSSNTQSFLLADHLGSTSVTTDSTGVLVSSMLYTAFGETRSSYGSTASDYRYTGQREESEIGFILSGEVLRSGLEGVPFN